MDLFLTDFSNGYHLSSKGIKRFLEMPIGAEKKSQATDNRLKNRLSETLGSIPDSNMSHVQTCLSIFIALREIQSNSIYPRAL